MMFSLNIYFLDFSVKNYLTPVLTGSGFEGLGGTDLPRLPLTAPRVWTELWTGLNLFYLGGQFFWGVEGSPESSPVQSSPQSSLRFPTGPLYCP